MKANKQNFRNIKEVAYNLTGLEYYLWLPFDLVHFWQILKFVKSEISKGELYKYPLYNVGRHANKPYIGNSLEF